MCILESVLVHFLLRALKRGQEDNEAIKRFITYHFEQHIREHPGERIVLLFDMTGAGVSHLVNLFSNLSFMITWFRIIHWSNSSSLVLKYSIQV